MRFTYCSTTSPLTLISVTVYNNIIISEVIVSTVTQLTPVYKSTLFGSKLEAWEKKLKIQ